MHARIGPAASTAVLCHAWFFFGFLYEEIVDVPNMMIGAHAGEAQSLWDPYHSVTNPVFYYAIVAVPALGSLAFLWLKRGGLSPANQTRLRLATRGHLAMAALTLVAVTQINGTLYFGPPINDPARVDTLAWTWFGVNALRIGATAFATVKLIEFYLDIRSTTARDPA
ncbi:hypothetical protein PV721_17610 [Streptomyces sp. MB09-01]|uniref:hypothetical protein n=1 Tax=unclassified Streptomyces TaxID=2593676 RepID=UPI0029BADEB1|nr:hypothetical protein [Streptomyces sp. MB09-01]MDX3536158.1 hypothetical protein [Streptomyces sp. MB09-01]